MIEIQKFREAAKNWNEARDDYDAQQALELACHGKRVLKMNADGAIDINESAEILQHALITTFDDDSAQTPAEIFAQRSPQIEADTITGLPLRKGKTAQAPIVDWSPVNMDEREVVGYGAELGEQMGSSEQIIHILTTAPDSPPFPRLRQGLRALKSKPNKSQAEEQLLLRVKRRLYWHKEEARPVHTTLDEFVSLARQCNAREVRMLLGQKLRTDSDLEAFCIDYFPDVKRRFGSGMNRTDKETLLLTMAEPSAILAALRAAR